MDARRVQKGVVQAGSTSGRGHRSGGVTSQQAVIRRDGGATDLTHERVAGMWRRACIRRDAKSITNRV
jgi:hypothetical protein